MTGRSLIGDIEARKLVEARWPQKELLVPRELLERLAPEKPQVDAEWEFCIHCAWQKPDGSWVPATRDPATHQPDCPWMQARRLLGDAL